MGCGLMTMGKYGSLNQTTKKPQKTSELAGIDVNEKVLTLLNISTKKKKNLNTKKAKQTCQSLLLYNLKVKCVLFTHKKTAKTFMVKV